MMVMQDLVLFQQWILATLQKVLSQDHNTTVLLEHIGATLSYSTSNQNTEPSIKAICQLS